MNICVIGALGFIGSNLMNELRKTNHMVVGVDDLRFGYESNLESNGVFIEDYNLLDSDFLNDFDCIVFMATSNIIYAMEKPVETFINNSLNALSLFSRYGGKIVYTSTSSVYGNATEIPTTEFADVNCSNAYDTSKRIGEQFLLERGNATILRLSNTFGINQRPENPYCGAIGRMIDRVLHNESIEIYGDGTQTRDFNYVSNVTDAIIKAIELPAIKDPINIASGKEIAIKDLATMISKIINQPTSLKYIPERKIDLTVKRRCLDITRAKKLLGWIPKVSLEDGLKKTIEWHEKENIKKDANS